MKLLIVAQAPSRAMWAGDRPLEGTTALTMLAKYAGVKPREQLYEIAEFINVIEDYPGPQLGNEKYDAFPLDLAVPQLHDRVVPWLRERAPCTTVFLGSAVRDLVAKQYAVCRSGRVRKPEWFVPYVMPDVFLSHPSTVYFSPHPGGTSMWWNDQKNRTAGIHFWHRICAQVDSSHRSVKNLARQSDRRIDYGSL